MEVFYLKKEACKIIGLCMQVHKISGKGHSENGYGNVLQYEFKSNSVYERKYDIEYKEIILPRYYSSDFTVYDEIILKIKAIQQLTNSEIKQTLNHTDASKNKIRLLTFKEDSLSYSRVIL
ncbi:MAG TPA: GxxExxY protein [Flavobacterium sp.]|jgi:GxxExxY protein